MASNENIGLLPLCEPKDPASTTVDIVFVHGLGGDRKETWTFDGSKDYPSCFWPLDLLPKQCPNARILTFGYNADYLHFYFSKKNVPVGTKIDDHSSLLLQSLANLRSSTQSTTRPIIFVAHSLGGIVCANALSRSHAADEASKEIAKHTCGTVFLGTPFEGSAKAQPGVTALKMMSWLRLDTNKRDAEDLKKKAEKLIEIREAFLKFLRGRDVAGHGKVFGVACYFETRPTFLMETGTLGKRSLVDLGVIVSKESAMLPGFDPVPLSANHSEICKFAGEWDSGYEAVSLLLARWIKSMEAEDAQDRPGRVNVQGDITHNNTRNFGGVVAGHIVSTTENGNRVTGSEGYTYKASSAD